MTKIICAVCKKFIGITDLNVPCETIYTLCNVCKPSRFFFYEDSSLGVYHDFSTRKITTLQYPEKNLLIYYGEGEIGLLAVLSKLVFSNGDTEFSRILWDFQKATLMITDENQLKLLVKCIEIFMIQRKKTEMAFAMEEHLCCRLNRLIADNKCLNVCRVSAFDSADAALKWLNVIL